MDAGIRAAREQEARERITEAVNTLAGKWGANVSLDGLNSTHKDPRLRGLFQLEALVPAIESLASFEVPTLEEAEMNRQDIAKIVLAIPGLTNTSAAVIQSWADEAE